MGDGAANLVFQMTMMFQLFFYTDVFGIKATAAGMILLIARVFDAFVDPIVGILSDRTNTRWESTVLGYCGQLYRSPYFCFGFYHLIFLNVEDFVCRNYLYFVDVDLFLQ